MIWKKHLFAEQLKLFLLFIASFYFLYILIDYSAHAKELKTVSFSHIALYYAAQFTKRAEVLIPVALMVATIKVVLNATLHNEIVALAAAGMPMKKIVSPCLLSALLAASFLYANFQYVQPRTLNAITAFEERFFKAQAEATSSVDALLLADGSLLIYQAFDKESGSFFDLFWLKSNDFLYRIHSLYPYELTPRGVEVDTFKRLEDGSLAKTNSEEEKLFYEMHFDPKTLFSATHPTPQQSLTQLMHHMGKNFAQNTMNGREAEAASWFYFKLTIPLLSLFAVLGPLPFCLRFERNRPVFLIFSLSLFAFIAYFALMSALLVVAKNQVLPPFMAIVVPQILTFSILSYRYAKL